MIRLPLTFIQSEFEITCHVSYTIEQSSVLHSFEIPRCTQHSTVTPAACSNSNYGYIPLINLIDINIKVFRQSNPGKFSSFATKRKFLVTNLVSNPYRS